MRYAIGALALVCGLGVMTVALAVARVASRPSAFNECVEHGEEVRAALAAYHAREGKYPRTLDELPEDVPLCEDWHGRTILSYDASPSAYSLTFGDWLVTHHATETDEFMAHQ